MQNSRFSLASPAFMCAKDKDSPKHPHRYPFSSATGAAQKNTNLSKVCPSLLETSVSLETITIKPKKAMFQKSRSRLQLPLLRSFISLLCPKQTWGRGGKGKTCGVQKQTAYSSHPSPSASYTVMATSFLFSETTEEKLLKEGEVQNTEQGSMYFRPPIYSFGITKLC